mmetsp:Transcript_34641/g.83117  ORF Transcript_34641/g.83117 Transcript_34641/m.83117 type:complete len:375 (+) Transcript_34641:6812-7936(+)
MDAGQPFRGVDQVLRDGAGHAGDQGLGEALVHVRLRKWHLGALPQHRLPGMIAFQDPMPDVVARPLADRLAVHQLRVLPALLFRGHRIRFVLNLTPQAVCLDLQVRVRKQLHEVPHVVARVLQPRLHVRVISGCEDVFFHHAAEKEGVGLVGELDHQLGLHAHEVHLALRAARDLFGVLEAADAVQELQEVPPRHGLVADQLRAPQLRVREAVDRHGAVRLLLQPPDEGLRGVPALRARAAAAAVVLQPVVREGAAHLGQAPAAVALQMAVRHWHLHALVQGLRHFRGQQLAEGHGRDVFQDLAGRAVLHQLLQVVAVLGRRLVAGLHLRSSADHEAKRADPHQDEEAAGHVEHDDGDPPLHEHSSTHGRGDVA